jgi:hypothetical protein
MTPIAKNECALVVVKPSPEAAAAASEGEMNWVIGEGAPNTQRPGEDVPAKHTPAHSRRATDRISESGRVPRIRCLAGTRDATGWLARARPAATAGRGAKRPRIWRRR